MINSKMVHFIIKQHVKLTRLTSLTSNNLDIHVPLSSFTLMSVTNSLDVAAS